jgi:hypothetical protein
VTKRVCTRCDRATKELQGTRRRVCDRCQRKLRQTARLNHVARTYGLTPDDYQRLLLHQDDRCAICRGSRTYELHVDHDHATRLVRGLLCRRCNKLLRDVRDSRVVLGRAITYLWQTPAKQLGIEAIAPEGEAK